VRVVLRHALVVDMEGFMVFVVVSRLRNFSEGEIKLVVAGYEKRLVQLTVRFKNRLGGVKNIFFLVNILK
jgi:hypothetical protein